ncbi:hypothetical protein TIFTF001_044603 [Ficus carica]|uniref:Uncharacterized protein n=1 Tax=Ficus carica TaxID=3494 RepID=A0AA87ZEN4_FICCA|nr:hypothetical protein TIFTF001_044603 [Ficus carica]
MVRLPRTMPVNPLELDLATVVANLQRQLLEQQRETDRLREQLARMNQRSQDNQVLSEAEKVRKIMKMFRTDISKQVSAGSSPPTLASDCTKKKEKAVVKQLQPDRIRSRTQRGKLVTLIKVPNSLGGTKGKGMLQIRVNKEITLKRGTTEEMRVIIMTTQYALNMERSTWFYVDRGRIFATFVAKKAIMQGNTL